MRERSISIEEVFKQKDQYQLIDVRTPAEFEQGHIPGAVNIPLFSNEERASVGTAYKKKSPRAALILGLEYVGPKMADFVRRFLKSKSSKTFVIHCWRGGQRSQSMCWLVNKAQLGALTLSGGYKAYRNFVQSKIAETSLPLIKLGGRTGTGKTILLHQLKALGEQIIDLEGLAHHKGSAFGWIGEQQQPSVETFENQLYDLISKLDKDKRIWVENESQRIGSIYIHTGFWKQMLEAPLINIELPLEERINILVNDYTGYSKEALKASFEKIKKRLGGQHYKAAIEKLDQGDYHTAADIALKYYDKAYQYLLEKNGSPVIHHLKFDRHKPLENAKKLIKFLDDIFDG